RSAGLVVDVHRLAKPRRERFGHQPAEEIGHPAGRGIDDEAHAAAGVGLLRRGIERDQRCEDGDRSHRPHYDCAVSLGGGLAMPVVKVTDLAFGRLQSPNLDEAEEFLSRFGTMRTERTNDRLYMRGTDPTPYIHITHRGPSKFLGLGFYVASEDDLGKAAKAPGATGIENIDEPGGGKRVRLTDPLGYYVDVIWGQREVKEIPVRQHATVNWGHGQLRH